MNLFNTFASNASAEIALLPASEIAEFEAWLSERDEEEYAWERTMAYADVHANKA